MRLRIDIIYSFSYNSTHSNNEHQAEVSQYGDRDLKSVTNWARRCKPKAMAQVGSWL